KLTWDNAAMFAPATADRLRLVSGDMIEITKGGRSVTIPAWISPGHAADTVTLHLGYGRTRAGRVASNIGVNVNPLRASDAADILAGVEIRKTGDSYELACTQDHWSLEGRNLVRVATTAEFARDPQFVRKLEEVPLNG